MNFKALKGMIHSLISTYKCPECGNEVDDDNVDVIGAAGTTINIDIECPKCSKHSMIKSEVMSFDLGNNVTPEKIQFIKETLGKLQANTKKGSLQIEANIKKTKDKNAIKDTDIVDLHGELTQKKLAVEDLFGEDTNKLDN